MSRVKAVRKPGDYPGPLDEATKGDLSELFSRMFPGEKNPEFKGSQLGWAILTAQSPKLSLLVARLTEYIALEMTWSKRRDIRELAVQALNMHFKCDFSFQSHLAYAHAAGLSGETLAAIPYWETSTMFDDEQRMVIQFTLAVVKGDVPSELFATVAAKYGEKQTIEFTTVVAMWSFWAMILNATGVTFPKA